MHKNPGVSLFCGIAALLAMMSCGSAVPDKSACTSRPYRWQYSAKMPDTRAANCHQVATCGRFAFIDCGSAADGPAYYVDEPAQCVLEVCGGFAPPAGDGGVEARSCPPVEWTCAK